MFHRIEPPLWGEYLKKSIHEVSPSREPLIENFLYRKSSQMIYAPDGAGKSLITLQAAIQGTVDNNRVFGDLHVEKGFKTLYIQAERDKAENLERMRHMTENTPFDPANFLLLPEMQGIDLHNGKHKEGALKFIADTLEQTFKAPDLIVFDPIYAMVRGGLKDDDGAAMVTDFARTLQAEYGCSILLVHHANRGQRSESGSRINEDMFGSRFLSAFCTGVYKLSRNEDEGSRLTMEKSSNENLVKQIDLHYSKETQLSWVVKQGAAEGSKTDKIFNFMRLKKVSNSTFTFAEIQAATGVSTSFLRKFLVDTDKNHIEIVSKSSHNKLLYRYSGQ